MSGIDRGIDKLKKVDWRGLYKTATQKVKMYTLNLSPLEIAVEDATNMETWGPHGSVMSEIAEACFDPEGYRQVLGVIARRLQERDDHWRMCYKALLLLEHLCKHGPMKVSQDVAASMSVMDRLTNFHYKDENGRDHGANVRHRATEIVNLVTNPDKLREEREKAKVNREKYKGVSGDDMRRGGGGFGGGSSGGFRGGGFDPASLTRPGGAGSAPPYNTYGGFGSESSRYRDSYNDDDDYSGGGGSSSRRDTGGGGYSGGGSYDSYDPGHKVSPKASPRGTTSGTTTRDVDAVSATRSRIEKLKLSGTGGAAAAVAAAEVKHHEESEGDKKKKLHDVRVNPKIAASLGLKIAPPPTKKSSSSSYGGAGATTTAAPASDIDLLGGLMDDEPAQPAGFAAFTDELSAPAPPPTSGTGVTGGGDDSGGGWDAFGSNAGGDTTTGIDSLDAPAPAPVAVDNSPLGGGLPIDLFSMPVDDSTTGGGDGFDPFATMSTTHAAAAPRPPMSVQISGVSTQQQQLPVFGASSGPTSPTFDAFTSARSPPTNGATAANAATSPGGKSEDAFAALTGIHKPSAAPMGERKGLGTQPPPLSGGLGGGGNTSSSVGVGGSVSMKPASGVQGGQQSKDPFEGLF